MYEGCSFYIAKFRLARSAPHIWTIVQRPEEKGVGVRIVDLGSDSTTPTSKLMLNVLRGIAQSEREMMLERQRIGIAYAQERSKFNGWVPTARRQSDEVMRLKGEGKSVQQVMAALKFSGTSVYRVIQKQIAGVA